MTIAKLHVEHCTNPQCDRNSLHEWIDAQTGQCARCIVREVKAGFEDLARTMAQHGLHSEETAERISKICSALERMRSGR